jgi:hypothetical protein
MAADVRKMMGEKPDLFPFKGSVMWGTGFAMRTMVNMMVRAGELLGRKGDLEFTMVATEEEAVAWVAALREKRAKKAS